MIRRGQVRKVSVASQLPAFGLCRLATMAVVFVGILWPSTAWANPIIAPITFVWPAAFILLAPVVIIEAAIAVRVVGVRFGEAMWLSLGANIISTVVGIPIGTCCNPVPLMFISESDTGSFASALLFFGTLLLPLYFLSVITEAWAARSILDQSHRQKAWRWAWLANLATYTFVSAGLVVLALIEWLGRRGSNA